MRIPISFILFAQTGVVFLVQLLPVPGIFLMMMAAMFWSVITLNAAFLAVFLDVFLGRLGCLWLALPVLWFGGYLMVAAWSHVEAARLERRVADNNAGKELSFSPAKESLVIEIRDYSSSSIAQQLVRSYAIPVAFDKDLQGKEARFRSRRIGGPEVCKRIRTDPVLREAGVFAIGFSEGEGRQRWKSVKGLCAYYAPEAPAPLAVTVTVTKEAEPQGLASYVLQQMTITPPAGEPLHLLAGYVAPLQWLPAPAMGCGLAKESWNCLAMFMRERRRALGPDGKFGLVPVIADTLGLKKSPASERRAEIAAAPSAPFDAVAASRIDTSLANLDVVIDGSPHKLNYHDFKGLAQRPDLLAPRAEAMVSTLNTVFDTGPQRSDDARNLQRLIAALPSADYARIGPALLTVFESHPDLDPRMIETDSLPRLADLGPAALPLLERLAKQPKDRVAPYATLGICRLGAPAAGAAEAIAREVTSYTWTNREWYQAAYVTERRLGRPDLAVKIRDDWLAKEPKWTWANLWDDVTADSPPDVCLDQSDTRSRQIRLKLEQRRKSVPH